MVGADHGGDGEHKSQNAEIKTGAEESLTGKAFGAEGWKFEAGKKMFLHQLKAEHHHSGNQKPAHKISEGNAEINSARGVEINFPQEPLVPQQRDWVDDDIGQHHQKRSRQ